MAERKEIYIIEQDPKDKKKTYWHRAGTGWVNKDGSVNFKLHVHPNVQFQLRDPKEEGAS
jgi:hypothetical protein